MSSSIPNGASAAILKHSEPVPDEAVAVQGPNFDERPTLETLLDSYERIGFQANSLGKAINIVNKMVRAPALSSNVHLDR
jgi:deoxyhypusine synthase